MLLYQPPFLSVDGLTAFPDHATGDAFYYISSVLELAFDDGQPAFWAHSILPAPSQSGQPAPDDLKAARTNLSFDVRLTAQQQALENLAKEIKKRLGRDAKALVPAPLASGKATLTLARPGAGSPNTDVFVYEGHAPSLIGENRAAFALSTQAGEAQALVAALTAGQVPAVVGYELQFLGLAPSFQARMRVHWKAIYDKFREQEMMNAIFVSEDIERTVETLKEGRDIELEILELDPNGAKAATRALFDELKSQVIKKLFDSPRPAGDEPVEQRITHGVRDILSSIVPGSHYTLRKMNQTFLSDVQIDLREQQVHEYPFYPQSTLTGLLERAGGIRGRLIFVRLEDLPNRIEDVIVEVASGAERLGVKGVLFHVQAAEDGRDTLLLDRSVEIRADNPVRQTLQFRRAGKEEPALRYRAEIQMDPMVAPLGKERWVFDWQPVEGRRIWFNPEDWLDLTSLRIEVDDLTMLDLPCTVDVDLEAVLTSDQEVLRRMNLRFVKDTASQLATVVTPEGQAVTFRCRETFRRPGEPDFVRDIPLVPGSVHRIVNPYGQTWRMEVRAVAAWDKTEALTAEFRVWDVLRRTWLLDERRFTQETPAHQLRFFTSLNTPRQAEVRVTRIGRDGTIFRGPWKDIIGAVAGISDQVEAIRRVRVRFAAPHADQVGLRKASVELAYEDAAHGIKAAETLSFKKDGEVADWVHPFVDAAKPGYTYKFKVFGQSGERFLAPLQSSFADDLEVQLPASPW